MDEDGQWTTLDLENINTELELEVEEDNSEEEIEVVHSEESEKEKQVAAAVTEEPKRKGRAQERIRNLVKERNEAQNRIAELQKQLKEKETAFATTNKEVLKDQLTLLDAQIEGVKKELRRAIEDGDAENIANLHEKLADYKVDRRIAEAKNNRVVVEKEEVKATAAPQQLPEEMQFWLQDNPWAVKPETREDRNKVRLVRKLASELLKEGFSEHEVDFYEEIDMRLEKAFNKQDEDVLELDKDKKSSVTEGRKTKQLVSGSSRTTPAAKKASSPTKISLSPEERAQAKRLNLSEQEYAKYKFAMDQRKPEEFGNWTTII